MSSGLRSARRRAKRVLSLLRGREASSRDYALLGSQNEAGERYMGWHRPSAAKLQDEAYRPLVKEMYSGKPRRDLVVAAEAVRRTGLTGPLILEVGCGSGYYSEILSHLLNDRIRYVGADYSPAMTRLAHARYPAESVVQADATKLPFSDHSFDIVMNGNSLMHILNYEAAIVETSRVARSWAIFHTVPVLQTRDTTILQKKAYGQLTIEVVFNENHLKDILARNNLNVTSTFESIPYDLSFILGEITVTKTYLCEVKH